MNDIEELIQRYERELGSPEYIDAARKELTALRAKAALADEMAAFEKKHDWKDDLGWFVTDWIKRYEAIK